VASRSRHPRCALSRNDPRETPPREVICQALEELDEVPDILRDWIQKFRWHAHVTLPEAVYHAAFLEEQVDFISNLIEGLGLESWVGLEKKDEKSVYVLLSAAGYSINANPDYDTDPEESE
jgi:hypothetical protein